jgi:hypothetical protein
MPIGSLIPGTPTPVTPNAAPGLFTTVNGPAVDGLIIADDLLAVIQLALDIQEHARATRKILEVITGVSEVINDNSLGGPSPQTVADTPRTVRDAGGTALDAGNSIAAAIGDDFDVEIGPLYVQVFPADGSATGAIRLRINIPGGTHKDFTQVFDTADNAGGAPAKLPVNLRLTHRALVAGTYTFQLFAWTAVLADSITITSPGVTTAFGSNALWPEGDSTHQQWCRILHIGPG